MKILFILLFAFTSLAQAQTHLPDVKDVKFESATNDAQHPCISEQEYRMLETEIATNQKTLGLNPSAQFKSITTQLVWPLKPSPKLLDCSYYRIAAYVDQNTAATAISDFNCGTNTYDGHKGTDIATWPFNFYKMDSNFVDVVAAASGTIIAKHDGEFDKNCASTTVSANYVIIQHEDGSEALYWHMKNGSITSKSVGASIAVGEHVGFVGSSGSSSGPHLHFEVWTGSTNATRIDPYSGTCNTLNATSWWTNQKPHKETQVVKVSVNTTDIVLPPCPATETLNESSVYTIPFQGPGLAPGYAKFYIFIRDEVSGMNATMNILNPDGSTNLSWTYSSTTNSGSRIMGYSKKLPLTPGVYTFQAIYNNLTCSATFTIVTAAGVSTLKEDMNVHIYPNPSKGQLMVEINEIGAAFEVYNSMGKQVYATSLDSLKSQMEMNVSRGIYFYTITAASGKKTQGKLVMAE